MTNVVYCAGPDLRSALSGHRLFCHQWMRGGNNTPRYSNYSGYYKLGVEHYSHRQALLQ